MLAALSSLGASLAVPMLKQEWRASAGDLCPQWHPGDRGGTAHVSRHPVLRSSASAHGRCPASRCWCGSALQRVQALFSLSWDSIIVQMASVNGLNTFKSCQQHLTSLPNPQQHSALRVQDKGENIHDQSIKISVTCCWAGLVNALWKWWGE